MNQNDSAPQDYANSNAAGIRAIRIAGNDARGFLQGQLTQDIEALSPDRPMLTGWTNVKGRLLFVASLLDWQDALWLILPGALQQSAQKRLNMFVLRAEVSIEAASATVALDNNKPEDSSLNYCFERDNILHFRGESGPALTLNLSTAATGQTTDVEAWRAASIRSGLPIIWPSTTEAFVPQMLNLDLLNAISFSKGCYVGQEIVARTQNLGRIKRRMYGFTAATDAGAGNNTIQPGDRIYLGDRETGKIVDAVPGPDGSDLLAVVPIDLSQERFCLDADGRIPLTPRPLPYAVPQALDQ